MQGQFQGGLQRIQLPQGGVVMLPIGPRMGNIPGGNNVQQMRPMLTAVPSSHNQGQISNLQNRTAQGALPGQIMPGQVRPPQTMAGLQPLPHNYLVTTAATPSLTPVPAPAVTPVQPHTASAVPEPVTVTNAGGDGGGATPPGGTVTEHR